MKYKEYKKQIKEKWRNKKERKQKIMPAMMLSAFVFASLLAGCKDKETMSAVPQTAEELVAHASKMFNEAEYIEGDISFQVNGMQEEESIMVDITTDYAYDVKSDICKSHMAYSTLLGSTESEEDVNIWTVAEENEDAKEYFTYSQKQETESWEKVLSSKTNDEMYRLDVFELMLEKELEMSLQEEMYEHEDEKYYVVDVIASSYVTNIITNEVDIIPLVYGNSDVKYDITLYFDETWSPAGIYIDFTEEANQESDNRGLGIEMKSCIFVQSYDGFSVKEELAFPEEVNKDLIILEQYSNSIGFDTQVEEYAEEKNDVVEYPIYVFDEGDMSNRVMIQEIEGLTVTSDFTDCFNVYYTIDGASVYNYVTLYSYNYNWAESDEQALNLLKESVKNLEAYITEKDAYTGLETEEYQFKANDKTEVLCIDMKYGYNNSYLYETNAFFKMKDKVYLRVNIAVVLDEKMENPIDTVELIEKLDAAMTILTEES